MIKRAMMGASLDEDERVQRPTSNVQRFEIEEFTSAGRNQRGGATVRTLRLSTLKIRSSAKSGKGGQACDLRFE